MKVLPTEGSLIARWPAALVGFGSLMLDARNAVAYHFDVRKVAGGQSRPSVESRLEALARFESAYEEFVEVLCYAAQFGPNERRESDYDRLRAALVVEYAELRPFLGAFLPPNEADAFRFEQGRPKDAFEQLFSASDLRVFLNNDDGEMIFRINNTRGALNLYGEHLRLLAVRAA